MTRVRSTACPRRESSQSIHFFDGRTVAAHGVWLDDADIATLKLRKRSAWPTAHRAT